MDSLSLGDRDYTVVHMRQGPVFWEGKEKATKAHLHADEESQDESAPRAFSNFPEGSGAILVQAS